MVASGKPISIGCITRHPAPASLAEETASVPATSTRWTGMTQPPAVPCTIAPWQASVFTTLNPSSAPLGWAVWPASTSTRPVPTGGPSGALASKVATLTRPIPATHQETPRVGCPLAWDFTRSAWKVPAGTVTCSSRSTVTVRVCEEDPALLVRVVTTVVVAPGLGSAGRTGRGGS